MADEPLRQTTLCSATLEAVEQLLSGDAVFYLPKRLLNDATGPMCADGDPPGAGWCQTAVDLVADTRLRAVNAVRAMAGKEALGDD